MAWEVSKICINLVGLRKLCRLHNICWHISGFIVSYEGPYLTGLFSKDIELELVYG